MLSKRRYLLEAPALSRKRRSDFTVLEIAQGKQPRLEKQVEHAGDRFMANLGFIAQRFSQARATMQSPGIPDRKYYNSERGVSCWWEAKAEDGKQREAQYRFQQQAEACGEVYLLGTEEVLAAWCQDGCPCASTCHSLSVLHEVINKYRDRYQPPQFRFQPPKGRRVA